MGRFIWRKHPLASLWAYLGIVLPLIAPIVALRAIVWLPLIGGAGAPFIYLIGIYAMALVYGLYYGLRARPLRHALDLRGDVRLLLPRLPALADVLRDPHLAQLELGHAARPLAEVAR